MINSIFVLASEAPNGNFLPGDKKEFYWGLVAFFVVFGFLGWKLGPIIKEMLAKGQAAAVDEATAADQAIAQAAADESNLRSELGNADEAGQRIIAEAQQNASQLRVDQNAKTQELVDSMWQRAQAEAGSAKSQLSADLSNEVSANALAAAEAVVAGNLDADTQIQLIEDYIRKVGSTS